MSKTVHFRTFFDSQHVKVCQALQRSAPQHFYRISASVFKKITPKISLIVICEILGLFVNTLTGDDNYCFRNKEHLRQPIQMQLPKKQKPFSEFFTTFLNFKSKFEHLEKKDDLHSLCIFEVKDCKKRDQGIL